jgi:hypothetical protein
VLAEVDGLPRCSDPPEPAHSTSSLLPLDHSILQIVPIGTSSANQTKANVYLHLGVRRRHAAPSINAFLDAVLSFASALTPTQDVLACRWATSSSSRWAAIAHTTPVALFPLPLHLPLVSVFSLSPSLFPAYSHAPSRATGLDLRRRPKTHQCCVSSRTFCSPS